MLPITYTEQSFQPIRALSSRRKPSSKAIIPSPPPPDSLRLPLLHQRRAPHLGPSPRDLPASLSLLLRLGTLPSPPLPRRLCAPIPCSAASSPICSCPRELTVFSALQLSHPYPLRRRLFAGALSPQILANLLLFCEYNNLFRPFFAALRLRFARARYRHRYALFFFN